MEIPTAASGAPSGHGPITADQFDSEAFLRIAILEDDPDQLAILKHWLTGAGHTVHGFLWGREIKTYAGRESFDLFLLDWQVPDISGTEILVWLRESVSASVPVLFVTARDSEEDIVYALERGADDYMIKPIRRQEMLARVSALLRRAFPNAEKVILEYPPFVVDTTRREITRNAEKIQLRPKEYELAVVLFRNIGRLLSRGHLQESVWGKSSDIPSRTVDNHVSQVRKKLNLSEECGILVTPVYQYGYRVEKL